MQNQKLTFQDEKEYTEEEVNAALAAAMYRYDELMNVDTYLIDVYEDIAKWQSRLDSFNKQHKYDTRRTTRRVL